MSSLVRGRFFGAVKEIDILVHTYSLNGYNIAIDGNSGSIHTLDGIAYDMLKDAEKMPTLADVQGKLKATYSADEIRDAYDEIQSLNGQGMLFSSEEKSQAPQQAQTYVPFSCEFQYAPEKGGSVPFFLVIAYCSGVRMASHSSSLFSSLFMVAAYVCVAMKNIIDPTSNDSNVHLIMSPSFFSTILFHYKYRYLSV